MLSILLLSAYHTDSHRRWCNELIDAFPDYHWCLLTLPGRHFAWRMRGSALSWFTDPARSLSLQTEYDVILATSMVDLNALIGLYPHLASAYRILYFHENQFEYPLAPQQKRRAEPLMVSLYSALSANRIVFNSRYNQQTFLDGVRTFLRKMPERVPVDFVENLGHRSDVIPVPLSAVANTTVRSRRDSSLPLIVWNHRWEYDKNPEDFFSACRQLSSCGVEFELAVVGQTFRNQPGIFADAAHELSEHIVYWGFQSADDYPAVLKDGTIVVSTAWHEFQGLSVLEAVQNNCVPLVPDRVCYPEIYDAVYRYGHSADELATSLRSWLSDPDTMPPVPDISTFSWSSLKPFYRRLLQQA